MGMKYSRSGISVSMSILDEIPGWTGTLAETTVSAVRDAAETALDYINETITPKKTGNLRDSAKVGFYKGLTSGTIYVTWGARSSSGYQYAGAQEWGGTLNPPVQYKNYTTPGTGPGFMAQTFAVWQQLCRPSVVAAIQAGVPNVRSA